MADRLKIAAIVALAIAVLVLAWRSGNWLWAYLFGLGCYLTATAIIGRRAWKSRRRQ
jgi:hypothetical protein